MEFWFPFFFYLFGIIINCKKLNQRKPSFLRPRRLFHLRERPLRGNKKIEVALDAKSRTTCTGSFFFRCRVFSLFFSYLNPGCEKPVHDRAKSKASRVTNLARCDIIRPLSNCVTTRRRRPARRMKRCRRGPQSHPTYIHIKSNAMLRTIRIECAVRHGHFLPF